MPRLDTARWAAIRALHEGAPPLLNRLAMIADVTGTAMTNHARTEGWRKPDYQTAEQRWKAGEAADCALESSAAVLASLGRAGKAARRRLDHLAGEDMQAVDDEAQGVERAGVAGASEAAGAEQAEDLSPAERLARLGELLSRQAGQILKTAEASGGLLNKSQIETLAAIIRLAEKFEAHAQERATEQQTRSDAELAEILQRVDDRIVELAHEYAERLVAERAVGG